ncbi:hypothetical protein AMECASPLE_032706 [Ameca splendens]|uniref:Uncharacterized protein n=1 Tax=Ameca splendens TaxID=208324 RepID=A0ABV0XVH7_9TELE
MICRTGMQQHPHRFKALKFSLIVPSEASLMEMKVQHASPKFDEKIKSTALGPLLRCVVFGFTPVDERVASLRLRVGDGSLPMV